MKIEDSESVDGIAAASPFQSSTDLLAQNEVTEPPANVEGPVLSTQETTATTTTDPVSDDSDERPRMLGESGAYCFSGFPTAVLRRIFTITDFFLSHRRRNTAGVKRLAQTASRRVAQCRKGPRGLVTGPDRPGRGFGEPDAIPE